MDADLKVEHGSMLAKHGKVSRIWTARRQPVVTVMSVQEFVGRFMVRGWEEIFERFDIIVMDEAHIPTRFYYAARAAMSSKGNGETSLLLLSATAVGISDAQSALTAPIYHPRRLEDVIMEERFMTSSMAVDRAMFIVESDERLDTVAKLLDARGCKVLTLSSGALASARRHVRAVFSGDSPNIRVLVAHERFGTGYGLPISKVLTTGLRQILTFTEDEAVYKKVPLTEVEITQHLGRANRGEIPGSGPGVVFLAKNDVTPNIPLLESERFGTAILLVAMGIAPCASLASAIEEVFPYRLSRRVAVSLVTVRGLPLEVVVRFLNEEGRIPESFARALDCYSLEHSGGLESREIFPKGYDSWFEQKPFEVLGYEGGPVVKVPLKATGELRYILQAIACIQAKVYVPEKIPMRFEDPEMSGPEDDSGKKKRMGAKGYRPPKVLELETKPLPDVPGKGFSVDVPVDRQPSYARRGVSSFNATFVADLNKALEAVELVESKDSKGRSIVSVKGPSLAGSPITFMGRAEEVYFDIPRGMWDTMVKGDQLEPVYVKCLMVLMKRYCADIAFSDIFANYGNPWLSVLLTFSNPVHLAYVIGKGMQRELLVFFGCLWERYVGGMHAAVNVSHESLRWWNKLVQHWGGTLSRPSADGRVEVAQSKQFKIRLYDIRAGFSNLMVVLEDNNVYSASAVAQMQRILPISRPVGYSVHDVAYQGKVRSHVKSRSTGWATVGTAGSVERMRARMGGSSKDTRDLESVGSFIDSRY